MHSLRRKLIPYICGLGANVGIRASRASIQHAATKVTNKDSFILRGLCFGCGRKKWNLLLKNLEICKRLSLAAEVKSDFNFGGFEDGDRKKRNFDC